jgi:hypothetical protein
MASTTSDQAYLAILRTALRRSASDGTRWRVEPPATPAAWWTFVEHPEWPRIAQGWKLHVTATVATAETVLRNTLPVLLASSASFKFAAAPDRLARLNTGAADPSAVGKFLTVYPGSDADTVRLARALDAATHGLSGPVVPSDRRLHPASLVSYRYGGFVRRLVQRPAGAILPALETPDGELVPDERGTSYAAPAWANDPFLAAGLVSQAPDPTAPIGDRYLPLKLLGRTTRGSVTLALDQTRLRPCVLKRACSSAEPDRDGRGPRAWLRHEAEVLIRLAGSGCAPSLYEAIEHDGDLVLVLEYLPGQTLQARLSSARACSTLPDERQIVAWGRELAQRLGTMHGQGLVFRDLKPDNVIVGPDGHLRLVDFGLATSYGAARSAGLGTAGYASPEAEAGSGRVAPTDDVYSLGALLYAVSTGAEPSATPGRRIVLSERPPALLNPTLGAVLIGVVERCLDRDAQRRYPSMRALAAALDVTQAQLAPARSIATFGSETEARGRADAARLARRLGDAICAGARPTPGDGHLNVPVSGHPRAYGFAARDINVGTAGIVLALAELVTAFGDPDHRRVLQQSARWLTQAPSLSAAPLPGLYIGEAGISLALLRAGLALDEPSLVAVAVERARWVATLPHTRLDLFTGTAGRLRFHLLVFEALGLSDQLEAARAAGEVLIQRATRGPDGAPRWLTIDANDPPCANYAHGAAGIADALLDLYEAIPDERYRQTASGAAAWLNTLARPVLADRSGVDWPSTEGGELSAGTWCHGAAGAGVFFVHAARLGLAGADDLAARASRTVARGSRWAGPSQCHGLAGSIELILDRYQATRDRALLADARALERALRAFVVERDGTVTVDAGWRHLITPDYMVGYGGVATCLLRLADPEQRGRSLLPRSSRPVSSARASGQAPPARGSRTLEPRRAAA